MQESCIVIPCFNEEKRLRGRDLVAFLDRHADVSFCLVDDGSVDGTRAVLERLRDERPQQVVVLPLSKNGGKGEAVRQGVRHVATLGLHAVIGYWDADLSAPLDESQRLLAALDADPQCQLVMGSRVKRLGAHIERRAIRHVFGRAFSSIASRLLDLSVYDSQCGAKMFRADAVEILFAEPFLTRWLFDLEIIIRLRDRFGDGASSATQEVPLNAWAEVGGSKLRLTHMMAVPFELLRMRAHYGVGRTRRG